MKGVSAWVLVVASAWLTGCGGGGGGGSGSTQTTSSVQTGVPTAVCSYVPHGLGPTYPVMSGQTWTLDFTVSCEAAVPTTYTQLGSVLAEESVTVPAGTFQTVKIQSTVTWTNASGTSHVESITTWRDAATGREVKEIDTITYGGTLPVNGYPISRTTELQSQS